MSLTDDLQKYCSCAKSFPPKLLPPASSYVVSSSVKWHMGLHVHHMRLCFSEMDFEIQTMQEKEVIEVELQKSSVL